MSTAAYESLLAGFDLRRTATPNVSDLMCLGFIFNRDASQVLLVKKARPATMAGKWNGLGGHLNLGESAREAMSRETQEESGVKIAPVAWDPFAVLQHRANRYAVYCFRTYLPADQDAHSGTDSELVAWQGVEHLDPGILADHVPWLVRAAWDTTMGTILHCWT